MKIYDFQGKKNICGLRLKQARKEMQLSQLELAERMQANGIALERDSISRIEIGTRFVADYELMMFSHLLEHEVEWFLD